MAKKKGRARRSKAQWRRRRAIALRILGGIALVTVIFLLMFQVRHVEVTGNTRYSEEEVRDMAMKAPLSFNTLLMAAFQPKVDLSGIPFMESIEYVFVSADTLRIEVTEKRTIGYVEMSGQRYYFDKDGVVLEIMPAAAALQPLTPVDPDAAAAASSQSTADPADVSEPEQSLEADSIQSARMSVSEFHPSLDDVPRIEGLNVIPTAEGQKLEVQDTSVFSTILALTRMIEKYDIIPDYVAFGENNEITMWYYGTVRASLGKDDALEEKMTRLAAILPELSGRSGTLHLENYQEGSDSFVFSEDIAGEDVPAGGGEE